MRVFISFLGLVALGALVWFGGPYLALGEAKPLAAEFNRLLTILVLTLLWGLNNLLQILKTKRINDQLIQSLATPAPAVAPTPEPQAAASSAAAEEVQTLDRRFTEALAVLKKTRLKNRYGEQRLYELPWYAVIGPPGAGKTTALANSGLNFPLADQLGRGAVRGIGGTRDCDWWFTDEAVLIDTAGRYTTQDSDTEVDRAGWSGFLDLLKKYRRRRPLNGVIVAISLADLLQQSEAERAAHAHTVQQRIQELYQRLGVTLPVYMLFTKTDLVAGFTEFFDDLSAEERDQVWGMTFPTQTGARPQNEVARFGPEFDALRERLHARLLPRLQQERDLRRRGLIWRFPQQMAGLKPLGQDFLEAVFRPSRYGDPFYLRGVYFTSGTQEGTPIDRIMGQLATTFGLDRSEVPHFSGRGRSYFLTDLFRRVIFPEAGLAGADRRLESRRDWVQKGAYAGAVGVTFAAATAWTTAYTQNQQRLQAVTAQLDDYQRLRAALTPDAGLERLLPALAALQAAAAVYDEGSLPWLSGFGLDQSGAVVPAARAAYRRALQGEFLPRLRTRLAEQIRHAAGNFNVQQGALKMYLMLGQPERLDPELFKVWMELDWSERYAADPTTRDRLKAHLEALLAAGIPAQPMDEALVAEARRQLNQVPLAERVYARLKQASLSRRDLAIDLSRTLGPAGRQVFAFQAGSGTVPALFTYAGFYQLYLKDSLQLASEFAEDNWVWGSDSAAGNGTDAAALAAAVKKRYLDDYIKTWEGVLNNLKIKRFSDTAHGAEVLAALSGPDSPLRGLLQTVAENTDLNRPPPAAESALGAALDNPAAQRLAQAVQKAKKAGLAKQLDGPGTPVAEHFRGLNRLLGEDGNGALEQLIGQLADVHGYLSDIATAPDGGAALSATKARFKNGSRDVLGRFRRAAARLPEPLRTWMREVARNTWSVTLASARQYLNGAWKSTVLQEYRAALKGRYPLYAESKDDLRLADFGRFFAPGGTLDSFFQAHLAPFVDTTARRWTTRTLEGQGLRFSKTALMQFRRARQIQSLFFGAGGEQPLVVFHMKPIDLDGKVSRFDLELDGQHLSYRHGPIRQQTLQWPGPENGLVRLSLETTRGKHYARTVEGPWAWFRVLNGTDVRALARDRFQVTFFLEGYQARYELQAESVDNPFRHLQALAQFRAPERL
ncbi:MAG TPA: type VI secretion system membrane subunit TssM [Gammaproteobacteria bacterium]|nr:type VI secretion system membrane subunit TssM [Gammaproteobacteria bacterium]